MILEPRLAPRKEGPPRAQAHLAPQRVQQEEAGGSLRIVCAPPGWNLSVPALGSFLSAHFVQVVAFLMDCRFQPAPDPHPCWLGMENVICKRKTLHLFTFVIGCPGDVLGEEVLGGSQPSVAMWA